MNNECKLKKTILMANDLSKIYSTQDNIMGFENINFRLYKNEIVAILGQSGCGKSTLLRVLAGLTRPCSGAIMQHDKTLSGINTNVKMVFQNYALLPWLSVQDNIALGLNATMRQLSTDKQQEILNFIKMIGLHGFERSYPSELSGGMCQRVGFARAIATNPSVLLLDEAFSALDSLTARLLRKDFLQMFRSGELKTNAVVMVTHNVREAIEMADRIIIMSGRPSTIVQEINIANQDKSIDEQEDAIYLSLQSQEYA